MLYVLLYPRFQDQDAREIARFRTQFEPERAKMVRPHITLVFGVTTIEPGALIEKTRKMSTAMRRFDIAFTRVEQIFDEADQTYKVFLLPLVGETIVAMHQYLYEGPHAAQLRIDVPYRPHMTIATHADAAASNIAVKETQRLGLPMGARLEAVTLVRRVGEQIEPLAEIPLSD